MVPRSAYLHIPFCAHKCGYCDFASVAGQDDLADAYLDALRHEIRRSLDDLPSLDTIFVGGGTPTRLSALQLERFCDIVRDTFRLLPGYEWTIEANPGTLDRDKVAILARHGVTRVSLGAQSFDSDALAALERNHAPRDVFRSVELVREAGLKWSLDLIFGAPGSSTRTWNSDLDTVLGLAPYHLSCYGLVYEKGTELWKRLQAGLVEPVDEDLEASMYETTIDRLSAAGLDQYEISNYAKSGFECRHNLVYWRNDAYYGFGLGAARYVAGLRATNIRDLPGYIRRIERGEDVTGPSERLSPLERAGETATLMIRRTSIGIGRADFFIRTGFELDALFGPVLRKHESNGLISDDGHTIHLTRKGIMLADCVAADFTEPIQP
ncbi:radical SAM family heme chaperone HemW [bacterium]|nr:radical SAM family heme chaperone HemW [bacterium]